MRFLVLLTALALSACATTSSRHTMNYGRDATAQAVQNPSNGLLDSLLNSSSEPNFSYDQGPGKLITIEDFGRSELEPVKAMFDERVAAGDKEIFFRINSFGGSIFAGNDLLLHINDVKRSKGIQVRCVVDFKAYSMGFVFLQDACDERLMTKGSTLLAHNGASEVRGTAVQMREEAEFLDALNDSMAEVCADRLKISVEEYQEKIAYKNWTMSWKEAQRLGAIDGTVARKDLPPAYTLKAPQMDIFQLLLGEKKLNPLKKDAQ